MLLDTRYQVHVDVNVFVYVLSAVRRSSHSLATDMFEQHLGAHLLQVTTTAPTPSFFCYTYDGVMYLHVFTLCI